MKPIRHATSNYKMLLPFIETVDKNEGYSQFRSHGYNPLTVKRTWYNDHFGDPVYSISFTDVKNGKEMRDPEIKFSIDHEAGTIRPVSYRNDYAGYYAEVFESCRFYYTNRLQGTDGMLWALLKNLKGQGFNPRMGMTLDDVRALRG